MSELTTLLRGRQSDPIRGPIRPTVPGVPSRGVRVNGVNGVIPIFMFEITYFSSRMLRYVLFISVIVNKIVEILKE